MKNIFSLKIFTLLVSIILITLSCSEENIDIEENDSSLNKELSLKKTSALEVILDMGFRIEDIIENKDFYIIEGDLLFPKELSFYENLQSNNRSSNSMDCRYGPSIVNTTDLLGNFIERTITIYSELDSEGQINELPVWSSAVSHAIFQLNIISLSSCLKFEIVNNPLLADIKIIHDPSLNSGAYALAGVQSGNNPFPTIRINKNRTNIFSTAISRSNTILHEIIHCLGFNGHQGSNSIMFPDPASLDFDGLRNIDKIDFKCVYDNCQDIIHNTVSISGTTEFCVNSNIHTYTLSNNTLNPTWSVTSNLIINSSNNTSVTVSPVNTGTSSIGIITAMFQDGSTATYDINIIGRPTPNDSTAVSGPSILKYYQSGLFYVSETNFDNYNTVEWVIYSYNFQNAIQHFNIQSPAGNNQFNVLIEVLPTAPQGNYVVQCRVSNNCGTYYIDKNFTVRSGLPQIFEL